MAPGTVGHTAPQSLRWDFLLIIALSLIPFGLEAWFLGGLNATGYSATDSQGRTMGFNDPLSLEHHAMIWRAGAVDRAIGSLSAYGWALLGMQAAVAAIVLCGHWRSGWFKVLLWIQPVVFFWGLIGLYALPLQILEWIGALGLLGMSPPDREGYIDIPIVEIIGQGAWLWACALIGWRLRRAHTTPRPATMADQRVVG